MTDIVSGYKREDAKPWPELPILFGAKVPDSISILSFNQRTLQPK